MSLPLRIALVVALSYTISIAVMVPLVFVGVSTGRALPSRWRFATGIGWGAVAVVALAFVTRAAT